MVLVGVFVLVGVVVWVGVFVFVFVGVLVGVVVGVCEGTFRTHVDNSTTTPSTILTTLTLGLHRVVVVGWVLE